jgi:hypothetical protein
LALAGLMVPRTSNGFLNEVSMGLQLYTLFNVIDEDVYGTLKNVAADFKRIFAQAKTAGMKHFL